MGLLSWVLVAFLGLALLYWSLVLWGAIRLQRVPRLGLQHPPDPDPWPRLSVVIPACNEADKIEPAVRSILAQDYPELEVVLVEDRSTDGTPEVVDRLAAEVPRLRVTHVRELPDGWLGKVHALHTGLGLARGEWALFTDADVHFAPGTLRRAVAWAVAERLDHLTALPSLWSAGLLVDTLVASFLRSLVTVLFPPWRVRDPGSRRFFGVGAFNLVRREAFDRTPGLEWLRMETADDMGVGLMMKRSGARCAVVSAFDELGLWWHRSLAEGARGFEKGYAALGRCNPWRLVAGVVLSWPLDLAPALAPWLVLANLPGWVQGLGLGVTAVFVLGSLLVARWARVSALPGLLTPLLVPITTAMVARAAWLGWRRGGIAWRGTFYPCEALRAGQRVKVPF